MRRLINGDLSVCNVVRTIVSEGGNSSKIKSADEDADLTKQNRVEDLPVKERNEAWEAGKPLRNILEGRSSSIERKIEETPSLFTEEEKNIKASEVKAIEARTKGMSPEEREKFLQREVDSRITGVIKSLEERDKRGDLEGVQPLGKKGFLYGGAGEPDKSSSGNPQDVGESTKESTLSPDALAATRLRKKLRADKLEREEDVNKVMGAILADRNYSIAKELATIPTQMVTGLLIEFQKDAKSRGDSGLGWAVAVAVVGLVEKAISFPFNKAIKEAQKKEWAFGEKYNDDAPEFLKILQETSKKSNKGKTSSRLGSNIDPLERKRLQKRLDMLVFDPDKDGGVGAGATIGETGNFYGSGTGGRQSSSKDRDSYVNVSPDHSPSPSPVQDTGLPVQDTGGRSV